MEPKQEIKQLVEFAWQARRDGDLQLAEANLLSAKKLCLDNSFNDLLVQVLVKCAHLKDDVKALSEALELTCEAVDLARSLNTPMLLAHSLRHLGDVYFKLDKLEEAESVLQETIEIYRNESSAPGIELANALRVEALLQERLKKIPTALDTWSEVASIYKQANITEGVEEANQHIRLLQGS